MEIVLAEPVYTWGRRPCEGFVPSLRFSASDGAVAARRRAHPGLGAACRRSNVADRTPHSYGGQHFRWSELRTILWTKIKAITSGGIGKDPQNGASSGRLSSFWDNSYSSFRAGGSNR